MVLPSFLFAISSPSNGLARFPYSTLCPWRAIRSRLYPAPPPDSSSAARYTDSTKVMVQAVVFDAGETLIDETRQWRLWADWLGVPHPVFLSALQEVIQRGEHHHRVFELLRPGFNLAAAREERRKAGVPDSFDAADLYPDAEPCLHELRRRTLRIGIAGNQPAGFEQVVRGLGLPVDFVACSALWRVEKPSPAFFQRIVQELNLPPHAIAYVGDRLDNDVLPALAAGMVAVFIARGPWGSVHASRPEATQAHLQLPGLTGLPDALAARG